MFKVLRQRMPFSKTPLALQKIGRVVRQVYRDTQRTDLLGHAGIMAYLTLGSIVPSLALIFAIISLFAPLTDPKAQWFSDFREFVLQRLAPDTGQQIVGYLERFIVGLDIKVIGASGFIGLLLVLILLLRNIEGALNRIWQVSSSRHIFHRFVLFWTFITLSTLVISLGLGLLTRFDYVNLLPFMKAESDRGMQGEGLAALLLTFGFFSFLYKIVPNCYVTVKAAAMGGMVATLLFRVASRAYAWYVSNNETYESIYGALAAVPFFLLWLYIVWLVTLLGAIVAWRYQQGSLALAESDNEAQFKDEQPLDGEGWRQIRTLLPLISMLAICEEFVRGEGKGMSGMQLTQALELPSSWVRQSLQSLQALGLIALSQPLGASNPDGESSNFMELRAYPAVPPDQWTVGSVLSRLTEPANRWIEKRDLQQTANLKGYIDRLTPIMLSGEYEASLLKLLKAEISTRLNR